MQGRARIGRSASSSASIVLCSRGHCHYHASAFKRRPSDQTLREQWLSTPVRQSSTRRLSTLSTVLMPPAVFCGLVVSLWAYKCLMMVAFQNKIIYMPSVPPFSRSEKMEDYATSCRPVTWRFETMRSLDGTKLTLAIGENVTMQQQQHQATTPVQSKCAALMIVYFQGNASSLPPRMPGLSSVLKQLSLIHI